MKKNEDLGIRTTERFKRAYYRESPLGDLLTDAMRDVHEDRHRVPQLRRHPHRSAGGTILYSHMFDVSPFDNFPAIVTMTGAQLKRMLEITSIGGGRGILQTSGLRYTFDEARDADKPAAQRNRLLSVTLADGKPLDPDALYRVATIDFLVTGEGLEPLMKTIPADRIKIDYSRADSRVADRCAEGDAAAVDAEGGWAGYGGQSGRNGGLRRSAGVPPAGRCVPAAEWASRM